MPGPESSDDAIRRLQEEYASQMSEMRGLVDQLNREDPGSNPATDGFTFEDQGMVRSAPGTEAFKQDFATWEALRQQATQALDRVESSLSRRLNEEAAKDRLASGIEGDVPAEYQQQVDAYFKALAARGRR